MAKNLKKADIYSHENYLDSENLEFIDNTCSGWNRQSMGSPVSSGPSSSTVRSSSSHHQCPYCPYVTYKKFNLTKHIRKHTGETPFRCPFCQYSTSDKSNLKPHIFAKHKSNIS
ncbi:UNVERIFIED_CONTAM: hypothetical protein RMT77_008721 [Armadillidium vulgare]